MFEARSHHNGVTVNGRFYRLAYVIEPDGKVNDAPRINEQGEVEWPARQPDGTFKHTIHADTSSLEDALHEAAERIRS